MGDGTPAIEIREGNGKLEAYIEFYAPVYPADLDALKQTFSAGANLQIAQPRRATVSVKIGNSRLVDDQTVQIDAKRHIHIRFAAEGNDSAEIMQMIEEGKAHVIISSAWDWDCGTERVTVYYQTSVNLHNP